jgi:hypothetical protein
LIEAVAAGRAKEAQALYYFELAAITFPKYSDDGILSLSRYEPTEDRFTEVKPSFPGKDNDSNYGRKPNSV